MSNLLRTSLSTPLGIATIEGNSHGISKIRISDEAVLKEQEVPEELKDASEQLKAYFRGELRQFNLKLEPQGTAFQQKVWQALQEIPFGTTCSYLQLAQKLGDIKAIRAVAAANGKNPLWVVVPCHRVIGKDGSLTGYAGGLSRKKWLLEHEQPTVQQRLF